MEDAFDCDRHRVETFGLVSGFSQYTLLQNKVKNLFCHFSLIQYLFSLPRTFMKTCRLSASSFVSPLPFLSTAGGILRIISLFDVKVASLMLRKFILRT